MIILITEMHQPEDRLGFPSGKKELYVSHGVCMETLNNVILPFEPLTYFFGKNGAKFDNDLGEWVLV